MSLWALADLHLSLGAPKPMDIFGPGWENHTARMAENWDKAVAPADTVLIPGDISWAMTLGAAGPDLEWVQARPGRKILLRGNHDYWWTSPTQMQSRFPGLIFLQNTCVPWGEDGAICGSRGWLLPGSREFQSGDQKIYDRECQRLRLSLSAARRQGRFPRLVMMHYPPCNARGDETGFTRLLAEFGVKIVVYGHLHGAASHAQGPRGQINGVYYVLAAGDFCGFAPVLLEQA